MTDQQPVYVTKWASFTLKPDGTWDMALWTDGYRPLAGKVFKVRIPVPSELVGHDIEAEVKSND